MTLQITTPHQIVRMKIPLMKMRKPPSPTTQNLRAMTKAATAPSAEIKTIDSTVEDMDLSSTN